MTLTAIVSSQGGFSFVISILNSNPQDEPELADFLHQRHPFGVQSPQESIRVHGNAACTAQKILAHAPRKSERCIIEIM